MLLQQQCCANTMDTKKIPGMRYQLLCPMCGRFVPVILFESSFYDFDTLHGTGTDSLYRLEHSRLLHEGVAEDSALHLARLRESSAGGQLVRVRDAVNCQACDGTFEIDLASPHLPGEEIEVDAICLPAS